MNYSEIENADLKVITNAAFAKKLIRLGYAVRDIKPDKNPNNPGSVFLFDNTPELVELIERHKKNL